MCLALFQLLTNDLSVEAVAGADFHGLFRARRLAS
jgi:hypothetical protein